MIKLDGVVVHIAIHASTAQYFQHQVQISKCLACWARQCTIQTSTLRKVQVGR